MAKLVGAGVKSVAGLERGRKIDKIKKAEAKAYLDAARKKRAVTHREMAEEERQKEIITSRAIAVAAASGGGVDDPTVINLIGDLEAEGNYRAMSVLWTGNEEAKGLEFRAEAARREGKDAIHAAQISAVTSIVGASYDAYKNGSFGDVKGKIKGWTKDRRKNREQREKRKEKDDKKIKDFYYG